VQVPLADMKRYSHMLAGASWMAEYERPGQTGGLGYIQTWSPYHLLKKDAKYPTPFFWTNTRDDRVHPGHARKMVAKLESRAIRSITSRTPRGPWKRRGQQADRAGHGAGYAYLWMTLK
jgi:prolyl oligopeptidase